MKDMFKSRVIKISECKNEEESNRLILENLNSIIDKNYRSDIYTVQNTKYFRPKDVSTITDINVLKLIMFKMSKFYYTLGINNNLNCESWLKKEIEYILEHNHCVFISIIIKHIVEATTKNKVNFNQGYYRFENNPFAKMLFGEFSTGFHAWCDIDGAVIDATFVSQQATSYNEQLEGVFFIGNQPEDITFVGYKEKKSIINKYLNELLRLNGFTYKEWLDKHIEFLNNFE